MDLAKTLAELRQQRDDIDQAILSLERLAGGRPRRPGRPPGRLSSGPKKASSALGNSGRGPSEVPRE